MILGAAPQFDEVTKFSLRWHERLYEKLKGETFELKGEDATRANFNKAVQEHDPDIITFFDHGNEIALIDNNQAHLLDSGNLDLVKGRVVYTMCCLAAKKLGADAYRSGCKAWWGYTKNFSFTTTDEEIFGRLANMGLLLRLEQNISWNAAIKAVKEAYDKEIDRLEEEGGNPWTIITLINDRNCLVCWYSENEPTTDCPFRMLGIALFGKAGQRISRAAGISLAIFIVSYTVALKDFFTVKGNLAYGEGGYMGFLGMLFAFILGSKEYLRWLNTK